MRVQSNKITVQNLISLHEILIVFYKQKNGHTFKDHKSRSFFIITKTQTNTFTFYFGVILCLILGTFNGEFHTIPRESSFLLCGTLSKKGSIAMYTQSHIVRNQYEH